MRTLPLLLALTACGSKDPAWAVDPIVLTPTEDGFEGVQTWQIYRDAWKKKQSEKTYLCAVAVSLVGETDDEATCEACAVSWTVTATLADHDCDATLVEDALFTAVVGLGVGTVDASVTEDPPWVEALGGWVDYGGGYEAHGYAWPEAWDAGEAAPDRWDGEHTFRMQPTFAWDLAD